jgi:poly-gamma-glutamate synthesis protein (capsule biosynthesis protein)
MSRSLTLAFAGDVMLGRLVADTLAGGDYARPWGDLLPVLRRADLFLINLECALTRRTEEWTDGAYKPFHFRADPALVATLHAGRVDFASVANNHIGDFGMEGLRDTLENLDRAGIAHAGAGADLAQAREPSVLGAAGTRVAVVAFADYPAAWCATDDSPGINYTPVPATDEDFDDVRRAIAAARERADLVVFSIHWGPNMRARPTPQFRRFAHAVVAAGADVFWGHSAHVLHGLELRGRRLILYDTGDLIDDYAVDQRLRNDLSALFLVRIGRDGVEAVEVIPVHIRDCRATLARGRDRDWLLEQLGLRCAELGATLTAGPCGAHVTTPDVVEVPGPP